MLCFLCYRYSANMRTACVTLLVVVVALGLSACLGQEGDDVYDDDNYYGVPQYSSGGYASSYPQYGGMTYGQGYGHGKGYGKGYGNGYGKGYGRVESTVIRAPYAAPMPMYMPPPPVMPVGGFGGFGGDDGIFGQNNGLILMLLLLPLLLSNSNGGLLG
ncbi:hypothetical protein KP79_PYT04331 [Mizuhopecten yessoensis]|uniref:Uncharacterized protein n=2 Tax=Mizuhopecten yessoensis TaxID=6573 RepID=A0A210QBM4_MIZYE|nr:hypothetical protein KP79_PYT04331 [Mizuhopecten yessoensis]